MRLKLTGFFVSFGVVPCGSSGRRRALSALAPNPSAAASSLLPNYHIEHDDGGFSISFTVASVTDLADIASANSPSLFVCHMTS